MSADELLLLDFWASPFAMRVKIALAEKGVEFKSQEENLLGGKSELLLNSNPVHKKVPVLLHDGKPVLESSIIVSYVDEKWPTPALLPERAYERSVARFWADFSDKKVYESGNKIWKTKGEEQEAAKKDFIQVIKHLEGALGDKDYFGGDTFGFTDIIIIPLTSWFCAFELYGNFKLEDECPKFSAWMKRCGERETVAKVLPEPAKVCEFITMLRKMQGIE
ncbi:uncharacterized protein A4U43_C04F12420 [Asparagus officinalis]|uniref:Glutathione S-transferase n=1 Tax=Asparagus officinalis TaxID=4686 RepID=A0A5P1F546_ASPOF|nr:probable glutathione S-transferase [Asparagus officinalis]ONK71791.1 uncharacterized protein A4U43_C04F12420 [Asparagus officinalis]